MRIFRNFLIVFFSFIITSLALAQESFTDNRDNQSYAIVIIGGQSWMAQNLNYQTSGTWCFDNKENNCIKLGRFYTAEAAQKACPVGWRLPLDSDWETLVVSLGGKHIAGDRMKESENGFNVVFGGLMTNDNTFTGLDETASFWSLSDDKSKTWGRHLAKEVSFLNSYENPTHKAYNIRCVKE